MTAIARATTKPSVKKTAAKPAAKKPTKAKAAPAKKPAAKAAAKPVKSAAKATPVKKSAPAAVTKSTVPNATAALCKKIQAVLDSNKAEDITAINLHDKCSFADFMIVASGRAPRHVAALADHVADMLKKNGTPALSIEGKDSGDWVLIDAGDIIVHVFRPEVRQFYNIEKMWALPPITH